MRCQRHLSRACAMVLVLWIISAASVWGDWANLGPVYDQFKLTLDSGHRTEVLGPLFYEQERETTHTWAVPPLWSYTLDEPTDFSEFDFLYPLLSYDRFGSEYRFHILQLLAFSGGQTQADTNVHRITLFPFFFYQRSEDPADNYTALLPFYGIVKNRLMRDEIRFIMMPLYVRSRKRDVVTDNYLYPIFHLRRGNQLKGWQVWPLVGHETKAVTYTTNIWNDVEVVGGHEKFFALWPLHLRQISGIGTTNEVRQVAWIPFYTATRSPLRDSTTYFWPFGLTITEDREKKYREYDFPWPLMVYARGEGKNMTRIFPFFSHGKSPTLESKFYAWPIYRYNRFTSAPLDRERTRILLFLYSDVIERNMETGQSARRVDAWPLFTARRDLEGNRRLQVLSILEPFIPNNKSIERNYSPLWSLWRSEYNRKTGASSQSLLWNLYRRDVRQDTKKVSLLLGLFQYHSHPEGKRWRLLYIPFGRPPRAAVPEMDPGAAPKESYVPEHR